MALLHLQKKGASPYLTVKRPGIGPKESADVLHDEPSFKYLTEGDCRRIQDAWRSFDAVVREHASEDMNGKRAFLKTVLRDALKDYSKDRDAGKFLKTALFALKTRDAKDIMRQLAFLETEVLGVAKGIPFHYEFVFSIYPDIGQKRYKRGVYSLGIVEPGVRLRIIVRKRMYEVKDEVFKENCKQADSQKIEELLIHTMKKIARRGENTIVHYTPLSAHTRIIEPLQKSSELAR